MPRWLAFAAVLTVALAVAAVAVAKTVQDADDTAGRIDIKSVKPSITQSGKIKFVVTFYENVPAKGDTGNEILEMWKHRPHALPGVPGAFKEAPYHVLGPQTGTRDVGKGGEAGTQFHKTGTATVSRSGKTLTFVLKPKAIGSPKDKFFWHMRSDYYGPESVCPGHPCEDHAPDGSVAVKQLL